MFWTHRLNIWRAGWVFSLDRYWGWLVEISRTNELNLKIIQSDLFVNAKYVLTMRMEYHSYSSWWRVLVGVTTIGFWIPIFGFANNVNNYHARCVQWCGTSWSPVNHIWSPYKTPKININPMRKYVRQHLLAKKGCGRTEEIIQR